MRMGQARDTACRWVEEEASSLPGFRGAYFSGSITALADDAPLPVASDVDVKLVMVGADVSANPQKFVYRGVVLDVSSQSIEDIWPPETALASYFSAAHFTHPCIISDPSGDLAAIQAVVQRDFARREWVYRRCEHARVQLRESLTWLSPSGALHDQVVAWLFPIIFAPPMVLVADLRNPTHRRGLATLRQVLNKYGHPDLHERLLGIIGSAAMSRAQVETLVVACTEAFDVAQSVRATPFLMSSNISDFARPLAIGGARELIEDGYHREAMPWITFVHTLCQKVLQNDASGPVRDRFAPGYERLLLALSVPSYNDLEERNEQLSQIAPDLWGVAEEIVATNPAIRD